MSQSKLLDIIAQAQREEGKSLDLSHKGSNKLPPELWQLTSLQRLNLSGNQLSSLPPDIGQITGLKQLYLSKNQIIRLPPEIEKLTSLQRLDLSRNQINYLTPEITQLTGMEGLYLSNNQIDNLPPEIGQLTKLKVLILSNNQLSTLPPEIGHLADLQTLDLRGNQINALPPELGKLTKLKVLCLSNNRLSSLPPELGQLSSLQNLDLLGNQLSILPPEVGQLTCLQQLILSRNLLINLPPELWQLTNLQYLNISSNQLNSLPHEIGQLSKLQKLYLSSNQISSLPPELWQLARLMKLNLSVTHISSLPPEIGQLTKLQELNFSVTQLSSLPPEIGQLTKLQALFLIRNQFSSLPPEVGHLTKLQKLYLSSNQISSLPPEIGQLTKLQELNLSNNQLSSLPPEVGLLSRLEKLELDGNPLTEPPQEVLSQGIQAVLAYLRELLEGAQHQWVCKMALVGQGGVGKTCLLRSLRGEPFEHSPTTRGVEIHSLGLPHPTQADVQMQLNAWDFGGQDYYHAPQQFYLTDRSLFLLVWNARHGYEQGRLYYWLDAIQARAPHAPVLVVAAHIDERLPDLPSEDLRRKYPQIAGFYAVSNLSGEGLEELRRAIAEQAACLPLMGERWPKTWLAAAEAVRQSAERYTTPTRLSRDMAEHGVRGQDWQTLARWLHELGDLLYFQDDPELNDLVILKPDWVSKYINQVLDSPAVAEHSGLFSRLDMEELWNDLDPGLQAHFLRLMERFDLSYRTLDNREISLVVERLPLDPPAYQSAWEQEQEGGEQREMRMLYYWACCKLTPTSSAWRWQCAARLRTTSSPC